jgi:XisI protein
VETFLQEEADIPISNKGLERQIIADHKRAIITNCLFAAGREVSMCIAFKSIWIQQNWTELQITDELMARGVAKDDIVLGFIPEYERSYTGFAIS